jgi:orotidine-5'-phosphate decarboxylase
LVVGLDTDPERLPSNLESTGSPADRVVAFNREIVEHTADLVCAYKPNAAFYEALGQDGFRALKGTVDSVRRYAPDAVVILDAKRADIGSTNTGYARALFDQLGADAITVHPYLGREALGPFLEREDKLIFVLARTSNPGAGEFQDLVVDGKPLYRHVAQSVARSWNAAGNCGLVVGATYPEELGLIREDVGGDLPILIPGIGAQGGDLGAVVDLHRNAGSAAYLVNASRSILYASSAADFADAAREEARSISEKIRAASAS